MMRSRLGREGLGCRLGGGRAPAKGRRQAKNLRLSDSSLNFGALDWQGRSLKKTNASLL